MAQRSPLLKLFYAYTILAKKFYYRHSYYFNMDKMLSDGNAVVMVGNHQNCMMDPLHVEWAIRDRKPYCLVRADIYENYPTFGKFLHWLGLLPVKRMNFEDLGGLDPKQANKKTFDIASQHLLEGNTLVLFPEGGHQDKRWLGYFSLGYLTLAFQAAERSNYEKEVYIQPFAHHYGKYHRPHYDFAMCLGTPIALSPYYERYKEHPRSTMREINALVETQIGSMMLNIRDLDHYVGIDFLRTGPFGREYAIAKGYNPDYLPEKWEADKQLVADLAGEEGISDELDRLQTLETKTYKMGMRDWLLAKRPRWGSLLPRLLLLLLGLPFVLVSLLATFPIFLVPRFFYHLKINGAEDPMFRSTWQFGSAVLITLPLFCFLPTIIMLFFNPLYAVLFFVPYVIYLRIVTTYQKYLVRTMGMWRYVNSEEAKKMSDEREEIVGVLCVKLLNDRAKG